MSQFFTPSSIAEFMGRVGLEGLEGGRPLRVLDLGAGVGALSIAVLAEAERLQRAVELVAVEADPATHTLLLETLETTRGSFPSSLRARCVMTDALALPSSEVGGGFDLVVSNPPYQKLSPSVAHGGTAPNAYARFMSVGLELLRPGGRLCFIVPRSFASGFYYRRFRNELLRSAAFEAIHVFESRSNQFDEVLQENVIVSLRKASGHSGTVRVSSSEGTGDLGHAHSISVPHDLLVRPNDPHQVIRVPTSDADLRMLEFVDARPFRLRDFGLEVSTGPVVPFRLTTRMGDSVGANMVPLLWMQHVRPGVTTWPLEGFRKPQYFHAPTLDKYTVPCGNYVLMRRFSAKEEHRRLVAAPLFLGQLPTEHFAIENHVNFIHRPSGAMSVEEVGALTDLLNSELYDRYFRIMNGNTQVSSTEIRELPLPQLLPVRVAAQTDLPFVEPEYRAGVRRAAVI